LAHQHNLSHAGVFKRIKQEISSLPKNNDLTKKCCSKYSGILNIDGKYVKVKGYKKKIPFIYGIDFLSHDPIVCQLALSESKQAYLSILRFLKEIDYPLKVVVADEIPSLRLALKQVFPGIPVQLCHTHFLENIRNNLHVRTDPTYRHFFNSLNKHLFHLPQNKEERVIGFARIFNKQAKGCAMLETILHNIQDKQQELFTYQKIAGCPATNNIIESSNSHLQARLKSIKGFQSFSSAESFLNAYLIKRRTKPFTDCGHPFKHLNGFCSLQMTISPNLPWPKILDLSPPKTWNPGPQK